MKKVVGSEVKFMAGQQFHQRVIGTSEVGHDEQPTGFELVDRQVYGRRGAGEQGRGGEARRGGLGRGWGTQAVGEDASSESECPNCGIPLRDMGSKMIKSCGSNIMGGQC